MQTVEEPGLTFGYFPTEELFKVEESNLYQSIRNQGVRCVEFLWYQTAKCHLWVVEAKNTCPRDDEIEGLCEKLINGFNLTMALALGSHATYQHELPQAFNSESLCLKEVKFIIVRAQEPKYAYKEAPQLIEDKLIKRMRLFLKTWGLKPTSVKVLSAIKAKKQGLPIISNNPAPPQ
jgi:hypothetical protein